MWYSAFCFLLSFCIANGFLLDASCQGRCGKDLDHQAQCQCNSHCTRFHDCCHDYQALCHPTSAPAGSHACPQLAQVTEQLWANDVNRFKVTELKVNVQTKVPDEGDIGQARDMSSSKLFSYVDEQKLGVGTYSLFRQLRDNYDPVKGHLEITSQSESMEQTTFLTAVLNTKVMDVLLNYSRCQGWANTVEDLRQMLKITWFGEYPRSGSSTIPDTSGFEHIMIGEYKSSNTVNGFHNWISFYEEEKAGRLNYYGYVLKSQPDLLIGAAFLWNRHYKALGSFLLGVSPEFELALYSLCYWTLPGKSCSVSLGGQTFSVMTYNSNGHIATAFMH